jgi:hypothetical protein
MIKILLVTLWACGVALGSSYATSLWKQRRETMTEAGGKDETTEFRKSKPLNVPIVQRGEIQGYIIAQLGLVVDVKLARQMTVPPELYLLDEGFTALYSDPDIDFRHFEQYKLDKLKKTLLERLRARLKSDAVKDVLIHEFNYVLKGDLK